MLNLYHLRYFIDAARLGGISAAALNNSVSQSEISQAIRSLEIQLKTELIRHRRNRFQLTAAGANLVQQAGPLFQALTTLQESIHEQSTPAELTIGTSTSLGLQILPAAINAFQKLTPKTKVRLQIGNSEAIRAWIQSGEIDLGIFVDDGKKQKNCEQREISQGKFVVFRSNKIPAEIKEGIIVTRRLRPEVKKLRSLFRKKFGSELPIAMEIISWEVIKSYVLTVGGFGFAPDYVIAPEFKGGKLTLEPALSKQINYSLVAVLPSPSSKRELAESFIESLRPCL